MVATKQKMMHSAKVIDMDPIVHIFCFLSVLLIGADKWGIDVGVTIKLNQVFLVIFTLLLIVNGNYRLTRNRCLVAFIGFSLISTIFAYNFSRSILFWAFIVYNAAFVFYSFSSYVQSYGLKRFVKILRETCYVQFLILLLQFLLKVLLHREFSFLPAYGEYMGIPRFNLWFYEPSYLATYITFWFCLSCFMFLSGDKSYWKDIIMGLAMFLMATATTGFVAIAVVLLLSFGYCLRRITRFKVILVFGIFIALIICRFVFSNIYDVFIARLFNSSLNDSTGGRVAMWRETWNVFIENPLFGIGPGGYGYYLGEGDSYVPSNVTLELMATVGIFAAIAFYLITCALCIKAFQIYFKHKNYNSLLLMVCAVSLLVFTVILQVNQSYLRLYHWMFLGILQGGCLKCQNSKSKIQGARKKI